KSFPLMPKKLNYISEEVKSSPLFNLLSTDEYEWFYWTNYSRTNPKDFWDSVVEPVLKNYPNLVSSYTRSLKHDLYSASPLPIIQPNEKLLILARNHATDLAKKMAPPSHNSTNGKSFQIRMVSAGIENCAAENISFGPSNTILSLVLLYIDQDLPDLGHRKTLLAASYTQMGIGIGNYHSSQNIVIQDFACDQTR
ncbi:MAG: CAP domain-containing protein, partial [Pyrinomonadaceae bacterium]